MLGLCRHDYRETWKVATTFVGTIVGAGFASGQEILKFFSHFGISGISGLCLSFLLFAVTGTMIMLLGQRLQAASFAEVVRHVCGRRMGPVIDLILSLFLFGSLTVMLAGAGAVLLHQWGLPAAAGIAATVVVSILTVFYGIRGIINANSVVVPLMILICAAATIPAISATRLTAISNSFFPAGSGASGNWIMSAILYVSYNIGLGVSVLAPLGREIKNRPPLILGGLLGAVILSSLALIINLAILSHYPDSAAYEIPSLFVAGRLAPVIQLAFSFVLWAEIFTTVIGSIFGLASRLTGATGWNYRKVTVILMLAAAAISQVGFTGLVGTLYPFFGYVSLVFLAALLVSPLVSKR